MEIKEKIRKVYQKNNIIVSDETIEAIIQDEERTKGLIRLYKQEEMDSMNYILGKDKNNKVFTQFELEAMSKIDLFNRKVVEICKIIWKNKDNTQRLEHFIEIINEGRCSECM